MRWAENAIPASGRRTTDHATRMEMKRRYEEDGESCRTIAEALDTTERIVGDVLRSLGVQMRRGGGGSRVGRRPARRTDDATRALIQERYESGETCREITAATGVARSTVYDVLRSLGVTMRPAARR